VKPRTTFDQCHGRCAPPQSAASDINKRKVTDTWLKVIFNVEDVKNRAKNLVLVGM
jgi:hypothetical protein